MDPASYWVLVAFQGLAATLPENPETNSLPVKMDGWKMSFLLGFGLFSVAKMSGFREGKFRGMPLYLTPFRLGSRL